MVPHQATKKGKKAVNCIDYSKDYSVPIQLFFKFAIWRRLMLSVFCKTHIILFY